MPNSTSTTVASSAPGKQAYKASAYGYIAACCKQELGNMLDVTTPTGGMSAWVRFKRKYPLRAVARKVAREGMLMSDGLFYNTGNVPYNALRMGFASLNPDEIATVVSTLKKAL